MTKIISLSEVAYSALKSCKHEQDSFSDVILRITGRKSSITGLSGTWSARDAVAAKALIKRDMQKAHTRTYVLP